jgi:WD40 repeat protein
MVRSPDGKTAAVLCGKTIELWDVLNRKHIGSLEEDEGIDRMLFSPDGKTLSVADRISRPPVRGELRIAELRIWDVEKRKRLRSCKTHSLVPVGMAGPMKKPVMVDTSVNFGRLRRLDEPVKTIPFNLVDAFTGDKVVAYEWDIKDGMMPSCFVVNRDETILATAGINSSVHLWDRNSGKRLARFKPPPSACQGLGFSPDGNILLFLYGRGHMEGFLLYAVPSGKILADEKHSSLGLVFSPDGRLLAGEGFREIKLWSIPEQWRKKDK